MTLLLAVRGNIATRSMSGLPFALQLHRTTVWCGATNGRGVAKNPFLNETLLSAFIAGLGVLTGKRSQVAKSISH